MKRLSLPWLWAVVVCALLAHNGWLWLGHRLTPDTDILALLPVQERDPVLQKSFTNMVDAAQQRVVVLIGAPDWEQAKAAASRYMAVVDAEHRNRVAKNGKANENSHDNHVADADTEPLLQLSNLNEQSQNDWLQSFQRHRGLLISAGQEAQLRKEGPAFWLEAGQRALYSPFGGPKLGTWREDPFGLFAGWVQERAQETPVRPRDGWLYVQDLQADTPANAGAGHPGTSAAYQTIPGKVDSSKEANTATGNRTATIPAATAARPARHFVLLPLTLNQPAFSLAAQQRVIPLLASAKKAAMQGNNDASPGAATPAIEVIQAGVVLHAASAGEQAGSEVSTIGVGSLLGIVLLMWFSFRSLKPIALVLLSIGIGCLGAISVCSLLFERIHILTLVFSATLIGVAQDYGLYFLCNRLHVEPGVPSRTLLRQLMPGLLLTMTTTVIGYMGLAMTPFPGLRQMALFSAVGLVFSWLTVVLWFPAMVAGGTLTAGKLVGLNHRILQRWPLLRTGRPSAVALALFLLVAAIGCARLGVNDDIRLLQNSPPALIQDQIKLSRLLDAPTPVQFFLLRGDSVETVLQREEQLKAALAPLIASGKLGGVQAISNWVPSQATQNARRALLEQKLLQADGPLAQLATQLEEDANWLASTRQSLLHNTAPLQVADFLRSPASEPWRHLWLGQSANAKDQSAGTGTKPGFASIIALRGLQRATLPQLQQIALNVPGVQWVDKVEEISSVLGRYRQNMGWVVLGSYLLVYLLMLPRYGCAAWRALLPTALASIATLAILGFSGQPLQLFHILALMLLLGVGVDYGIFMQEHPGRRDPAPWLAVSLSAICTILSFGLLALSNTPALRAFGLTMLIGATLVWLIVPLFGRSDLAANDPVYDDSFDATNEVVQRLPIKKRSLP